ncbi:MAG: FemAB family PEP-CTERM system-associated protein [Gammaproteobacteria bacterium]|nr:FemAB family PEP-CTERM system-associated protein [Gammaproteobacteria bacterium]
MNHQRRKAILIDPLSAYTTEHPDATDSEMESLKIDSEQYQALKKRLKDERSRSKAISRKIGEAKQQGHPCESLKQAMQTQSRQVKQLNEALKEQERLIYDWFSAIEPSAKEQNSKVPAGRTYSSTKLDLNSVTISLLGKEIEAWNAYVTKTPSASIYHRAEWKQLIKQTFGHDGIYCLAKIPQHGVVGILPLIRLKSRLFGDFLVSMPYFNYGGPVADHPVVEEKLMAFANDEAARLGVEYVEYRDDIERQGLQVQTHKVNMQLALPVESDELWNSFSSKLRAQIKRPYRENPQIKIGGMDLLDDFYQVFAHNMRDLGTPVYAKSFFTNILQTFPSEGTIICVKLKEQPVAAGFLLSHGRLLEIPWASTVKSANPLSVNMLLYWEVLKFGMGQGFEWFDFGRSTIDAGTYRFKRQWGAQPKQLYWHYWLREGQKLPSLNPSNPKYALMIAMWKKLPLALTRVLGPPIVKNLP